jgi:hypothetical protein
MRKSGDVLPPHEIRFVLTMMCATERSRHAAVPVRNGKMNLQKRQRNLADQLWIRARKTILPRE